MIRLDRKQGMNYEKILEAMTYDFYFKATDETGKRFSGDLLFDDILSRGVVVALQNVCGFDPQVDKDLIDEFVQYYNRLCLKD